MNPNIYFGILCTPFRSLPQFFFLGGGGEAFIQSKADMSRGHTYVSYPKQSEMRSEGGFQFRFMIASESYVVYSGCCHL